MVCVIGELKDLNNMRIDLVKLDVRLSCVSIILTYSIGFFSISGTDSLIKDSLFHSVNCFYLLFSFV